MLELDNIHFSYGEKKILNGISFHALKGEIVVLIGISGSGKTTLFRLITGLLNPNKGKILIDGPLPPQKGQITYMQQEDLLLPWRNVLGNLLLFTELGNRDKKKADLHQKALSLLKKVGLEGLENAYPNELSGGMRQRVALARSLLQERPILLLDEPFGSLDVIIREQLYTLLKEIREQYQKTIVLVTHDFRDAVALADRILILSDKTIGQSFSITPEMREDPAAGHLLMQKIREGLLAQTLTL